LFADAAASAEAPGFSAGGKQSKAGQDNGQQNCKAFHVIP
jgi:hypothetical protein